MNQQDEFPLISHRVPSWLRPEGKLEIIQQVWGQSIPYSLWYFYGLIFPESASFANKLEETTKQLFVNPERLEAPSGLHGIISSAWEIPCLVLKAVNANIPEIPMSIKLFGRICPLNGVGDVDEPGYINFADPENSEFAPIPEAPRRVA